MGLALHRRLGIRVTPYPIKKSWALEMNFEKESECLHWEPHPTCVFSKVYSWKDQRYCVVKGGGGGGGGGGSGAMTLSH